MKRGFIILAFLHIFMLVAFSQVKQVKNERLKIKSDSTVVLMDSMVLKPILTEENNSSVLKTAAVDSVRTEIVAKPQKFKPDPSRSIWMGAIIPGYGQIVNKKYWKLPIVYGGFLGFAYAISWNNSRYTSYKNAYRDILLDDRSNPVLTSYMDILPKGYTIDMLGGWDTYTATLKTRQDIFRRYRDLSIILSVGYYALVLVEAFVDAQMYDFDISPDLVLNVMPTRIEKERNSPAAYGMQCRINF